MRRQRGGCGRWPPRGPHHAGNGETPARAVGAQQRAPVHGHGRHGGGGPHRGRRRPGDPHGGRPAGGFPTVNRDRCRPRGAVRAAGLYGSPGPAVAACAHRPALPRCLWRRGGSRPRRRHTGSSAGFILAFLTLFETGDRVAIASPGYPPYRHVLSALGCEPVMIETTADTRWEITSERLIAIHRQKPLDGVLVASPANPTGTMIRPEALAELIGAAEGEGIRFLSDEIYHGLDYAFPAETAARLSDRAVVINSFSKYFCMTGWRIGWMVVPEPLVRSVERLQQNLAISVPTLAQIAAEAAFDGRVEMEKIKHG